MFKVVFLAGPTAVGKTEYAIRLAEDLNGEIISADSMQIYRYMDIGSAKPTADERRRVKHWLVDEIDPKSPFNVSSYQQLAKKYINDVHMRAKLPIVCGGTGLYFNSLLYEMDFAAPEGDEGYRKKLLEKYDTPEKLFERLRSLDSSAAKEDDKNNLKRIARYIERLEKGEARLAGFADIKRKNKDYEPLFICLCMDRKKLYERINRRVDMMMAAGLPDEVKKLREMGFKPSDIAMKGIGYKELMEGRPQDEAAEEIKKATRHYAKRQIIWFRRYGDDIKYFDVDTDGYDKVLAWVKEKL